jgi:hypothetical protein
MKTVAKILATAAIAVAAMELWERVKPAVVAKALELGGKKIQG